MLPISEVYYYISVGHIEPILVQSVLQALFRTCYGGSAAVVDLPTVTNESVAGLIRIGEAIYLQVYRL